MDKYYDRAFQAEAGRWWNSLSINEMKRLEKKHELIGHAGSSDIARIYDQEILSPGSERKS